MGDSDELEINEALKSANFTKFFALISQVNSSYQRHQLALQAIEVAKHQKDINVLKRLVEIEFDRFDTERLFECILQTLVELNAIDTAFGIIIGNENKKLEPGDGWYLLAKVLLSGSNLSEAKQIFRYIEKPYQQAEIIKSSLNKVILPAQLFIWLEWFELYTQCDEYISLDFKAAISALAGCQDFKQACKQLQKINPSERKHRFLQELYIFLIIDQNFEKLCILNSILPDEINWLVRVLCMLDDELNFSALTKLGYSEVVPIITLAITRLLIRYQQSNDEDLAKIIIKIANLSEKHHAQVIESACEICFKNLRLDTVINLLPLLSSYTRKEITLALLEHNLRAPQYCAILQQLETLEPPMMSYGYMTDAAKIIQKIPKQFVADEYKRRAQQLIIESQENFATANAIGCKHPDHPKIMSAIDKLLEYKQYEAAFSLCQKLAPSKKRDVYLMRLFYYALIASDFIWSQQLVGLCSQREAQQLLGRFLQCYRNSNYRAALKALIQLKNKLNVSILMLICVHNVLTETDSMSAINFLVDNGVFNLIDNNKDIKRKMAQLIVTKYTRDRDFIRIAVGLRRRNINEFELYLLKELLANSRFVTAISLLNVCFEEKSYGRKELPSNLKVLERTLGEYIEKLEPSIEALDALGLVDETCLQVNFIRQLLKNITKELSVVNIGIISAIPQEKLRTDYLIEVMVRCIEGNKLLLAMHALLQLPNDHQVSWSKIVEFVRQDNNVGILNVMLSESVKENKLLYWTTQRWLVNKSPDYLLENLQNFCQCLRKLDLKNMPEFLSDAYNKFFIDRQNYQELISKTFSHWVKLLISTKNYQKFLTGIAELFPFLECFKSHVDFPSSLKAAADAMLEDRDYDEAFTALQWLIKCEKDFSGFYHYFFERFFGVVLKQNQLEFADKLLAVIQGGNQEYWMEKALIQLSEIYFALGNYKKIIDLLKPYCKSYTIQQKVKDWAVHLIKIDKVGASISLIDTLLMASSEGNFIEIVEQMIAKNKPVFALKYLQVNIKTPGTKLRLQNELKVAYLETLGSLIGKERVNQLQLAQQKLAKFMQLVKNPQKRDLANQFKNEILTELRSQLDKAFLAFYRRYYGEPPLVGNNILNVFFPVIPTLNKKTIRERLLLDYFKNKLRIDDFDLDFPRLYQYLEYVQPLQNTDYIWLGLLYKMVNTQKHDIDLPLQPEVDGGKVNMLTYLPVLIDGVTELLLKISNPRLDLAVIQELQFSRFVPLVVSSIAPELDNFNIFQAAAVGGQNTNNIQPGVAINKVAKQLLI